MQRLHFVLPLFLLLSVATLEAGSAWRGMGQRMRITVQGWNGGGSWSRLTRTRHYSAVPFRRFRIVLQTFQPGNATPIIDTNYTSDYFFQVGFEYPYVPSNSAIPPRIPVTFGGSNYGAYSAAAGPWGYIVSDIIDLGFDVPTNAFFGLWTTIENQAGAASASNTLPYIDNMCNLLERWEGSYTSPSSLVGSNWAHARSNITHVGTNAGGYSQGYAPSMMLIEADEYEKSILMVGDSICYGVGEGTSGSTGYGDSLGSALGNSGYGARWVAERLHYNYVNFGRGSDGFKYATAFNWRYRYQLMALANPTHVFSENLHNDAYSNAALVQTLMSNTFQAIRAACPGAPIIQACCTPNTDSSGDQYATTNAQVPTAAFLATNQTRNLINEKIRTMHPGLGHDGYVDPNPVIEAGYVAGDPSTITSLWKVDGTPYAFIFDGIHPNSRGAAEIASGLSGNPFIPSNLIAPSASFTASPAGPVAAGTTVTFSNTSAKGSGAITNWAWDFGCGTASNWPANLGQTACLFSNAGSFTVRLSLRDQYGQTNSASLVVAVTNPATNAAAPSAPSVASLSATETSASSVLLAWPETNGDIAAWRVYRSFDAVSFSPVATLPSNARQWTDSNLIPFVAYTWCVAASNALGESASNARVTLATARRLSLRPAGTGIDARGGRLRLGVALAKNFPEPVALNFHYGPAGSGTRTSIAPAQFDAPLAAAENATNAVYSNAWSVPSDLTGARKIDLSVEALIPGTNAILLVLSNIDLSGFFRVESDLKAACAVGSPWRKGDGGILFANITADTRVKIFSVSGRVVAEFSADAAGAGAVWMPELGGSPLPPGIYLAQLTSASGERRLLKIMISAR